MTPRGDLRAWLPLNDATMPPSDHSANQIDATLVGEPMPNHMGVGSMPLTRFDGGEYVDLGSSQPLSFTTPPVTLMALFVSTNSNSTATLVGMLGADTADSVFSLLLNQGQLRFKNGETSTVDSSVSGLANGQVHHAAARIEPDGQVTLFADGEVAGQSVVSPGGQGVPPVTLGGDPRAGNYLTGALGDARVYRRAVSDAEIAEIARRTLPNGMPTDGIAYYPYDGDPADQWGTTTAETETVTYTTGKYGQAAETGDTKFVHYETDAWGFSDGDPLSLTAWLYPYALPDGHISTVGNSGMRHDISITDANELMLRGYTGSGPSRVVGSTPISTNEWVFAAVTFDGSTGRVYHNGDLDGEGGWTHTAGSYPDGIAARSGVEFTGRIDDVRVFDRPLAPSEVTAIYEQSGPPIDAPSVGLTREYPLSGSTTETIVGADGTATNVSYIDTPVGSLADFNGTDSVVDISVPHLDNYTVAAWVGPDASTDGTTAVPVGLGTNNDISITKTGSRGFTFTHRDSTGTAHQIETGTPFADGLYHLALTYDGSRLRGYANGGSVGTTTAPDGSTGRTDGADRLGMEGVTTASGAFDGQIGSVRIYNGALSPLELRDLYTNESGGYHRQYHFATR